MSTDIFADIISRPEFVLDLDDLPEPPVYRMPERDEQKGPAATLEVGKLIYYSRAIRRVGYEVGVHSLTKKQWYQVGLEIVAEDSGIPIETVAKVLLALNNERPFKYLRSAIYDRAVRPLIQAQSGPNKNVRAMWFYDLKGRGTIDKIVRRMTGKRHAGYVTGWDEPECHQAYLADGHVQRLYQIHDWNTGEKVFIYPDDAKVKQ